jgi:uncharacterized membrane protein YfcA
MASKLLGASLGAILILVVLAALGVFAGEIGLFFVLLLAVALIPMLIGVYAGLKLRAKKRADAERARGSVLKHVWEERQHREW